MKKSSIYRTILKRQQTMHNISKEARDIFQNQTVLKDTYLCVIGPVLVEYVKWVLKEAVRTKVEHLYFLARDGYSMYQIAIELCREEKLPFSISYLHASRYSLRTPQYHLDLEEAVEQICLDGISVTFEKIVMRTGITSKTVHEIANILDYPYLPGTVLSRKELSQLKIKMNSTEEFQMVLMEESKSKYSTTMEYLEDMGLLAYKKIGIVDSGWVGSIQKTLNSLLATKGTKINIEGFYFGLYSLPREVDRSTYHGYFFEPDWGIRRKAFFSNCLFECMTTSPEGMTIGYEKNEHFIFPVLEGEVRKNREEIELGILYLIHYTKCYRSQMGSIWNDSDTKQTQQVERLLYEFMARPSMEEVEIWGNRVFCDDVIGEDTQKLAANLTKKEIRDNYLISKAIRNVRGNHKNIKQSAWLEGSLRRNRGLQTFGRWQIRLSRFVTYMIKAKGSRNCEKN